MKDISAVFVRWHTETCIDREVDGSTGWLMDRSIDRQNR